MKIDSQIEWSLWIKWAIATGIAFLANGVLLSIFSSLSAPVYYIEGFVIAFFQWLFVLRSRHEDAHKWIWVTGVGWALGVLSENLISFFIVNLIMHGLIIGAFQWMFFLRKLYSKAYLWVLVNAISWLVAVELAWLVLFPSGSNEDLFIVTSYGIVFGAMTGAALLWLTLHSNEKMQPLVSNENGGFISMMDRPVFRYISATVISTIITIVAYFLFGNNCRTSIYQGYLFLIFIAVWISWIGLSSIFQSKSPSSRIFGMLLALVFILVGAFFCIVLIGFWIAPVCD